MALNITFIYPEYGSADIDLETDISLKVCDDESPSGVSISNITIDVDGHDVFSSGAYNCEFDGSFRYDGYDGYCYIFNFKPVTSYSADKEIVITATHSDGYFAQGTSVFTTECSDCLNDTFIAQVRGASGLYSVRYTNEEQTTSDVARLWNESSTYPRIISDNINDVFCKRVNENTYVAVSTESGLSIVKNCLSSLCYGGSDPDGYGDCLTIVGHTVDGYGVILDGYCTPYNATKAYIDNLANLYILNSTLNRVETFYNIEEDITGRLVPDFIYNSTTVPDIDGYAINNIEVIEYFSTADDGSNTIVLSTDNGVIRIDADESSQGVSETNMNVFTYGTASSSAAYDVLGGSVNRIVQTKYDRDIYLLAVAARDATDSGGVSFVDMRVHVLSNYVENDGIENISYVGEDPGCYIGTIDVDTTIISAAFNVTFTVV